MQALLNEVQSVLYRLAPTLIAVAGLFACGTPFHPAQTCYSNGATIYVEAQRFTGEPITDCGYYTATLQQAIDADSVFTTEQQMTKITKGLHIWVHQDNLSIVCEGEVEGEWGCEDDSSNIETNSSMSTVAHEMLHVFSDQIGISHSDNLNHTGWATKGSQPGAKSYFSGQEIFIGSWFDVVNRWMWQVKASFVDEFCGNTGNC